MDSMNKNRYFDIWDEFFSEKGIKNFFPKDFAEFSVIIAVCFSISLWIFRAMGYFYMLGRFSVYNIDKSYIDVWTDGFLMQIIQSASICVLLFVINYVYFQLSISKDKKIIKIIKKMVFFLIEFVALNGWVFFAERISLLELLKELPRASKTEIIDLVIIWVTSLVIFNVLGVEATIFYRINAKKRCATEENEKEKKADKEQGDEKNNKKKYLGWIRVAEIFLITCSGVFFLMYVIGCKVESQRNEFKYVLEEEENVEENRYVFTDTNSGKSYKVYPIVFENQDVYIMSRIYKKEGRFIIDCGFLKVRDKENVNTHYFDKLRLERDF